MIIGQDFDSETAYHNTKNLMQQGPCNPCMRNLATWGRLITILKGVGICPKDCFFTNFFMGLRKGNKATGLFPGSNDANFVRRCQEFMKIQLEKQQPRLVITLGTKVPLRLAVLSSQLSHWAKAKTFSVLDTVGSIVHNVQFQGINSICSVVALTHPSFRPSNVGRRRYQTFHGEKAEITMICEAMKQCGIYS